MSKHPEREKEPELPAYPPSGSGEVPKEVQERRRDRKKLSEIEKIATSQN